MDAIITTKANPLRKRARGAVIAAIAAAALFSAAIETRGADSGGMERVRQCRERCSSLHGAEKNNCFKSCLDENRGKSGDRNGADAEYSECEARCGPIEGEKRVQCMRTCLAAKRKNAPARDKRASKKMSECENACVAFKGLDKIKCIRKCMDGPSSR